MPPAFVAIGPGDLPFKASLPPRFDAGGAGAVLEPSVRARVGSAGAFERRVDPATGMVLMRLSNGASLCYRSFDDSPNEVSIELEMSGGSMMDDPGLLGATKLGVRTMAACGAAGFSSDVIDKFAELAHIRFSNATKLTRVVLKAETSPQDRGVVKALQLLRITVADCDWVRHLRCRAHPRSPFL
jgi:hypothetical protein